MDDYITYMGYLWVQPEEDGVIVIGLNDDGLDEFSEINGLGLPEEDESVLADEVCGEIETDQGPLNLYSPVRGTIIEVNESIIDNPSLIMEDCYGDGWLLKIEADRPEDVRKLSRIVGADDEEDEGDDQEDSD